MRHCVRRRESKAVMPPPKTHEHAGEFKEFRSYSNRETVRVRLYYLEDVGSLSVEEILAAGGPPQKQKKEEGKDR